MPRSLAVLRRAAAASASASFCAGGGEADPEAFRLAGPAFAFCLGDACGEAGADVAEPLPLGGVDAEHRAADAAFSELTV
jgi:hypothetical protein